MKCTVFSAAIILTGATFSQGALIGTPANAVPDLIIDLNTGTASLDTEGQVLSAYQIQSAGTNATITLIGDGDGFLTQGLTPVGSFFFTNASRDENGGSIGTLASGIYNLGQLYDPTLVTLPLSQSFVLADLRFGFDGDSSANGNGGVRFIPEPASIAFLGAASLMLRRRTR